MSNNPADRPFTGRQLTRRERRRADRLATERAAARAKAMPPPEVTDRTDPVTGLPVYMPGSGHDPRRPGGAPLPDSADGPATLPAPSDGAPRPSRMPMLPTPAPTPAPAKAPDPRPAPAARRLPRTTSAPPPASEPAEPRQPRRRGRKPAVTPSLGAQRDRQQLSDERRQRLRGPITPATATKWLFAGLVAFVIAVAVASAQYTTGSLDTRFAAGSLAGATAGAFAARRGWARSPNRARFPALGVAAVLVAAVGLGAFANPVVIDERVLPDTSTEARSVRLASTMSADLRRMAELDNLLVADLADARAQVSAYDPARKELVEMSNRWGGYTDVPDPVFAGVVEQLKVAAYWESEAMATKLALIEESDARYESDLETQRASFTESWLGASAELTGVGTALGIPVSEHDEGPHE